MDFVELALKSDQNELLKQKAHSEGVHDFDFAFYVADLIVLEIQMGNSEKFCKYFNDVESHLLYQAFLEYFMDIINNDGIADYD